MSETLYYVIKTRDPEKGAEDNHVYFAEAVPWASSLLQAVPLPTMEMARQVRQFLRSSEDGILWRGQTFRVGEVFRHAKLVPVDEKMLTRALKATMLERGLTLRGRRVEVPVEVRQECPENFKAFARFPGKDIWDGGSTERAALKALKARIEENDPTIEVAFKREQ